MKEFSKYLIEASLGRVWQHTQNRNIGMISASRGDLTPEENNRRTRELKAEVRKAGFGFIPVKGRYVENHGKPDSRNVDEHALLVIGKDGDDKGQLLGTLKNLGSKYGQDSILHKPHNFHAASLHGTNDSFGRDKVVEVGDWHPNRAGEFHSLIRGKKPFEFSEETWYFVKEPSFFNREEILY
jgi:hypothetical protein